MKVALVYDRVNKWGGAERVLLALHEIFPDAVLYTAVYDSDKAPWAKVFPKVTPSFLQKIPLMQDKHELLAPLMPLAFESFNFSEYDLVISVTSEAAKGIITRPPTKHVCYCLTPTRYLWSGYNDYFKDRIFKSVSYLAACYLRKWDKIAAQRPDKMIAISTEVQKRIKTYYERESQIVYPPVEVKKFEALNPKFETNHNKGEYYLIVSRLVPYKKADLAVKAFNELGLPLVVVGTGSEEKKLRKIAKGNILFKGFVNEDELIAYYKNAKAFIHPQEEDFGISAVEAQAAGCPVVAYGAGGALDTVIDGKTGVFFDKQDVKSLISVIRRFEKIKFNKKNLVKDAQKFSKQRFKREFILLIDQFLKNNNI